MKEERTEEREFEERKFREREAKGASMEAATGSDKHATLHSNRDKQKHITSNKHGNSFLVPDNQRKFEMFDDAIFFSSAFYFFVYSDDRHSLNNHIYIHSRPAAITWRCISP